MIFEESFFYVRYETLLTEFNVYTFEQLYRNNGIGELQYNTIITENFFMRYEHELHRSLVVKIVVSLFIRIISIVQHLQVSRDSTLIC